MPSNISVTPAAGTLLADRYRLDARIAGGGMGEVWKANDEVLGRQVAIKFLRAELADDDDFRERLRREARSAGAISHPAVVPIFDYGEVARENSSDLAYLVMEYIDGPSLAAELKQHGALDAERTALIIEQVAGGLQAAHDAGVVHRDVKPANILVGASGDVKIADFGISRAADSSSLTRTGTLTGTAHYFSPEQASGRPATASSDIYSLGVVAYACLAGSVPFSQGNDISIALAHVQQVPEPLPDTVPAGIGSLVMRMLEKDPASRPASAAEVAASARGLLGRMDSATAVHHPFDAPTRAFIAPDQTRVGVPAAPPPAHSSRSRSRVLPIVVLLAVAAMLVGILAVVLNQGTVVPKAVGKQEAAAVAALDEAGLEARVRRVDRANQQQGVVLEQSASAGSEIDEGDIVTLTVATGNVRLPATDLVGATIEEAEKALADLGLAVRIVNQVSSSGPGTVLAIDPDDVAPIDSTVQLIVAQAPAPPVDVDDEGKGGDEDRGKKGEGKGGKGDD